jgi:hypothetical protein
MEKKPIPSGSILATVEERISTAFAATTQVEQA